MDYKSFKGTEMYKAIGRGWHITYAMLFLDPEDNGLSFTELKAALDGTLDEETISETLDILYDKGRIQQEYRKRNEKLIMVYLLNPTEKYYMNEIIDLMSGKHLQQESAQEQI
jgi:hypothetical protein